MHRIFLLRAYGDFVILLQAIIRSKDKDDYQLVASKHLEELYNALSKKLNLEGVNIQFIDFGISKNQLGLFTNKHFLRTGTLQEAKLIKHYMLSNPNNGGVDYIEQDKRIGLLNVLTGQHFKALVFDKPIYETYDAFFKNKNANEYTASSKVNKVVLFPDSRLPKKNIPTSVIKRIQEQLAEKKIELQIAYFKNKLQVSDLIYHNFETLIQIIEEADFVIGADSLPVHICNLIQKPHYIIYPTGYTQLFMTPFVKLNKLFGQCDHFDLSIIQ